MDRALDLDLLAGALDDTTNLPSPEELRRMLANAEVDAFFAGNEPLDPALLETAWNLHHVGTVRPALELYGAERQLQANVVAAHIFDLALRNEFLSRGERLVLTFAAQVSSIRGDRTPNATALARRLPEPGGVLVREPGRVSLELGCTFLSLNRAATMTLLRQLTAQVRTLETRIAPQGLQGTTLAAADGVIEGCRLLQRYLTLGDERDRQAAQERFADAANAPTALRDLDSRWVAAHLVDLCDDLGRASVWAVLPAGTPPAAAKSMTLGDPPVMTLWPPQIALLKDTAHSPLRAEVKRAVLTFPTSAGKTLLTQLVIAQHLATRSTAVCVVAPTHSLCREIREGLDRRLWVLRRSIAEDGPLGSAPLPAHAPVVVMTPERLAARLRSSEADLLEQFGLFVLDEAHLVGDNTRGWTFETTIARLHELTKETEHRLVLVSAAMGGTASVQTWLDVEAPPTTTSARWRGPRRLHATYTPTEDPQSRRVTAPVGRQTLPRETHDLYGIVRLYVDQGAAVANRPLPLGTVVRAGKTKDGPSRALQLKPIVELAASAGAVLTVHATKKSAEALAKVLADTRPEKGAAMPLVRLAELRLSPTHPLVGVLRRGVAYHHAALPMDVQVEVENAVRSGVIDVVCATTTLTEGVNLPVRTVVVCERGFYDGTSFHTLIDHADLLNAAGRAGRAGRETEGWIVLAAEPKGPSPRVALLRLDQDQDIHSTLATPDALAALADYEAALAGTAGIVLHEVPAAVDGFLSYCWYLADAVSVLDPSARPLAVLSGIRHTLAWHQLPQELRMRWEAIAERVVTYYESTDVHRRGRWARTGARLSANAVLERVALSANNAAARLDPSLCESPLAVAAMFLGEGRLAELLELVDERDRRFKRRRYGPTKLIEVDMTALVLDWIAGVDLTKLAARYLSDVEGGDEDAFRFEQLSAFLAKICEHHLPWTVGILLEWVKVDTGIELCPGLPAFIHYGVGDSVALTLMTGGVRSRRLAVVVGQEATAAGVADEDVSPWLAQLGASQWRSRFAAGPAEVADLLRFVRDPMGGVSAQLLDGQTVAIIATVAAGDATDGEELTMGYVATSEQPRPIGAMRSDDKLIATIGPSEHYDLSVLLDAGFRLLARLNVRKDETKARVLVRIDPD